MRALIRRAALTLGLVAVAGLAEARKGCTERSPSPAVGRADCRRFGSWDTEELGPFQPTVDVGLGFHEVSLAGDTLHFCVPRSRNCAGELGTGKATAGAVGAVTGFWRFQIVRAGPFRFGAQFEGGAGGVTSPVVAPPGVFPTPGAVSYLSFAVYAGLVAPLGRAEARLDVVVGGEGVSGLTSHVGAAPAVASDFLFAVTPRLGLAYYVAPHLAIGPWASLEMTRRDDFGAGFVVRFAFRAYDGTHD